MGKHSMKKTPEQREEKKARKAAWKEEAARLFPDDSAAQLHHYRSLAAKFRVAALRERYSEEKKNEWLALPETKEAQREFMKLHGVEKTIARAALKHQ